MGRVIHRWDKPNAAQTGALRAHLARLGVSPTDARAIVKMSSTREQIAAAMVAYLKGRARVR